MCSYQEGKKPEKSEDDDLEDDLDEAEEGGDPKPLRTTFELADTLYAEAELEETDTVYLWLGVRPILYEYKYDSITNDKTSRLM